MLAIALVELNRCSLCLSPPKKKQQPRTSSMFENTDPSNEAWYQVGRQRATHRCWW